MTDHITQEKRSWNMSQIRSVDTKAEILVRKLLHSLGYRFRLHRKDLPGKPDIVLPKYKIVIFIHGCFWHCHKGCSRATIPKSNVEYWINKFSKNTERDIQNTKKLSKAGWKVITVWECELKNLDSLIKKLDNLIKNSQ